MSEPRWYDSFLDALVWVGFPPQVPLLLFSSSSENNKQNTCNNPLPALSLFFVRALSRQEEFSSSTNKNNNNKNNNNSCSSSSLWRNRYTGNGVNSSVDPTIDIWCENLEKLLQNAFSSSSSASSTTTSNNNNENNNNSFTSSFSFSTSRRKNTQKTKTNNNNIFGCETDRYQFYAPSPPATQQQQQHSSNVNNNTNNNVQIFSFQPVENISSDISGDNIDASSSSHNSSASSSAAGFRKVSAVVALIVEGKEARLAREVFGANTNAVIDILSSIGLVSSSQQSQTHQPHQPQHQQKLSTTTVNGMLWTTLGTPQLQRCVLLQAAFFYVLNKTCGLNFELDDGSVSSSSNSNTNNKRWKLSSASKNSAHVLSKVPEICSVISGLISLFSLDEDCWFWFPTGESSSCGAVAGLLHVLSVLGFVSIRTTSATTSNDQQQQQQYVFKVLPELRDAALIRGAVDLRGGVSSHLVLPPSTTSSTIAASNSNNRASAIINPPPPMHHHHTPASTDCVIVETNFRVYCHLVPVRDERTGNLVISHRGETLLSVLNTFLDLEEIVRPVFAVFLLKRESFLRALRRGLTTEAIIRFLEAKSHPMAVAHYTNLNNKTSASSNENNNENNNNNNISAVPKALKDQLIAWGKEAERISVKTNQCLLTFPSSSKALLFLSILAQRCGVIVGSGSAAVTTGNQNQNQQQQQNLLSLEDYSRLLPTVFIADGFRIVIPEKMWTLISDLFPVQ